MNALAAALFASATAALSIYLAADAAGASRALATAFHTLL